MDFFDKDTRSVVEAKAAAQWIAFAPMVFQATRSLRNLGILEAIDDAGDQGLALEEIVAKVALPLYGVRVLLEAGLGIGLVITDGKRYRVTRTGEFVLHDEMTRVNMDFVHDVNYQGMFHLQDAIVQGKPAGLPELGTTANTVYAALGTLPEEVTKSWYAFEHFCSARAFREALPLVFARPVHRLMDVGANTGKWAMACAAHAPSVSVTMCDLPQQLKLAEGNIAAAGFAARITSHPVDVLAPGAVLPDGHDVIWMSQFLDCFSETEIDSIVALAVRAMDANTRLMILETYWDRQMFENSAFCLQQITLYFTAIANGNSQLYHSSVLRGCIERAGLRIESETDQVGLAHTLTVCVKR